MELGKQFLEGVMKPENTATSHEVDVRFFSWDEEERVLDF